MLKVLRPFYDLNNPEQKFKAGEYVTVEDVERRKDIIQRKLAEETKDKSDDVKVLKGKVGEKETATEEVEVSKEKEPKKGTKR